MKNIQQTLKLQGNMRFLPPALPLEIETFEKENGVTFPQKFKEWLLVSDGGELFLPGGLQIYGVVHNPLIDVNEPDRPNENFVVIGVLASGDPVIFEKGKETISIYNHEVGRIESDEVFDDFITFLSALKETLGIGG